MRMRMRMGMGMVSSGRSGQAVREPGQTSPACVAAAPRLRTLLTWRVEEAERLGLAVQLHLDVVRANALCCVGGGGVARAAFALSAGFETWVQVSFA
jgi:hypothetical protein